MANIIISHLIKDYHENSTLVHAVRDTSFTFQSNQFHTLVGRSGCGKTTLLRLLAGLELPTNGSIDFGSSHPRIGLMFQEPRLFPWLTVMENICVWQYGNGGSLKKAERYLRILGLEAFRNAYPYQLSGGMAQRVALGRTLAYEPEILLMDEPFGALDYFTRQQLQDELMWLFVKENLTILFITHDVTEAARLGQQIIIMTDGTIQTVLSHVAPYPRPAVANRISLEKKILSAIG
jgi:sulfonate transport system ATP-binding protein